MNTKTAPRTTPFRFLELALCSFFISVCFSVAAGAQESPKIVSPLNTVAAKIHASKTPIYLPTYLPTWTYKQYGSSELGEFEYGEGYSATVGTEPGTPSNASTLFYLSAGKGPAVAAKGASKVDLGAGKIGYFLDGGNFHTLDWNIGNFAYHIASYQPQSELVKIANSMVAAK